MTGRLALYIGDINPFRYRGYVYDDETGLYYLQSRYYNPAMGRFICADGIMPMCNSITDCNIYAYCNNCPVSLVDPFGYTDRLVGIGAQFGLTVGDYECGIEVIVYWDSKVCQNSDPVIAVYAYEGAYINVDELILNPDYLDVVKRLTLACGTNYTRRSTESL